MLNLLHLEALPILQQLQLEEALLRADHRNWCLVNTGSPPAIVMGISADKNLVVDANKHAQKPIPLIRRYSGGGTVVVEESTIFVTWILNHDLVPVPPYPREVLKWSQELYKNFPFSLRENDYVIGDKKCGGNAQYFAKGRLVHHTSFVWDYTPAYMDLLRMPPKMPSYREQRSHSDFLCRLKPYFATPQAFTNKLIDGFPFSFEAVSFESAKRIQLLPHRKATSLVSTT